MQILIIEDESAIADVLAYALKSEGYATHCCTLGSEGLAQLRRDADYALVEEVLRRFAADELGAAGAAA